MAQPGVAEMQQVPSLRARIVAVNGVPPTRCMPPPTPAGRCAATVA